MLKLTTGKIKSDKLQNFPHLLHNKVKARVEKSQEFEWAIAKRSLACRKHTKQS